MTSLLTDDNPRGEDPRRIVADIVGGIAAERRSPSSTTARLPSAWRCSARRPTMSC